MQITQSTIYPGLDSMLEGSRTNQAMEFEQESDTVRFLRIYDEHMNYVYRYINYRVMNPNVAADLTSTVFEKALGAFGSYRKEKAAPQTWLITIARNTVIDYIRQRSRKNTVSLDLALEVKSDDPTPEEQLERKEDREKLNICLSLLPTREQEIISLKFGAELNNRRIADVLRPFQCQCGHYSFPGNQQIKGLFL